MRLTIILIAVILLMGGGLTWLYTQYTTVKQEKKQAIALVLSTEKSLKTYKNELGATTARIGVLELSVRNAKDLAESERLSFARQFKGVKKNLKNVEAVQKIEAVYETVVYVDTSVNGVITILQDSLNSLRIENDSLYANMKVPLEGALLWNRKWFLGKRHWTFDVTCRNPYVTITGLEYIRIGRQ